MYFLVCVLIKITILVEIPSRPGRRELPIFTFNSLTTIHEWRHALKGEGIVQIVTLVLIRCVNGIAKRGSINVKNMCDVIYGWSLNATPLYNLMVQQIPDNHTMLNHTTLLFAPNLPGIKWNITNFALIMAQKALIITHFYSNFLYLILLLISFCQPESIVSSFGGSRDHLGMSQLSIFGEHGNWPPNLCDHGEAGVFPRVFPSYCLFSFAFHFLIL